MYLYVCIYKHTRMHQSTQINFQLSTAASMVMSNKCIINIKFN